MERSSCKVYDPREHMPRKAGDKRRNEVAERRANKRSRPIPPKPVDPSKNDLLVELI